MTRCPHCNGDGGGEAFINRGPDISKHTLEWVRCMTCSGDGVISDERAGLIDLGRRMREARVERGETLLEASRRLGTDPAKLSKLEHGRGHPLTYERFAKLAT